MDHIGKIFAILSFMIIIIVVYLYYQKYQEVIGKQKEIDQLLKKLATSREEASEELKNVERVKAEIEIAQQISMGLFNPKPPVVPGIELATRCLPCLLATQVERDYYDFFLYPDNTLGIVIADVSGYDVGSALITATARSTLRSEVLSRKSPAKILEDTNFVLYEDLTHAEKFITMFYAEYDTATQILRYSNGGHNHPIVLRDGTCTFLDTDGMLIGVFESVNFEEKAIHLEKNDFVVFYTDGVVEAKNAADQMFSVEQLCQVIETNRQSTAHELLTKIYEELQQYIGGDLHYDNMSVIVLKVLH